MSIELLKYKTEIKEQFAACWELNDLAHRETHFENVFKCGSRINHDLKLGYDEKLILFVAYFHDMFSWSRNNHHHLSCEWVRTTDHPMIVSNLDDLERDMVARGCLEHRASRKDDFSSLFTEMMNAADREYPGDINGMLERAILYRMARGANREEARAPSIEHLKEKFGVNGYARYPELYIQTFGEELRKQREEIMLL